LASSSQSSEYKRLTCFFGDFTNAILQFSLTKPKRREKAEYRGSEHGPSRKQKKKGFSAPKEQV
jgi:hypothetical protein